LFFIFVAYVLSATCNIESYGAKGDGKTDNTKAIQAAINACINAGTVVIPSGNFLTYPISVTSGTGLTIQLDGNLIAGTVDNWPVSGGEYTNFFVMNGCSGCTVTGKGMINGGGTPWYIAFDNGTLKYKRPNLMVFETCTNLKVSNIQILNSPQFNIILNGVQTAEIAFVNITCEWYDGGTKEPHNTDGIDPGSNSQNIHIHDCYIYNGDDSVAIKPGTEDKGCTSNILVENCQFYRGHGASIGSVGSGCVQNIVFRGLTLSGGMSGCNIKTYNNQPGFVKNITYDNIKMDSTGVCIHINTNYKTVSTKKPEASIVVSDIHYSGITGVGCTYPAEIDCQSATPCTGITMQNVNVAQGAKHSTMECQYAHGTASNVSPPSCLST
jgi:polygalacturonase